MSGPARSHWRSPQYAIVSLAMGAGAVAFRWIGSVLAQVAFAQDVWRTPPLPSLSSLSYEMYARRRGLGLEWFPRAHRHWDESRGREEIPVWVRQPYAMDFDEWLNRLWMEWGMTEEDELAFDHNWWMVTRLPLRLLAGLFLSSTFAVLGLKFAVAVRSQCRTLQPAFLRLPLLLPAAVSVTSALCGAYCGFVLYGEFSRHQERRLFLNLDPHSSVLYRFTRRLLIMYPMRATDADWTPDWVTSPPVYDTPEHDRWVIRLFTEWGVTAEDEEAEQWVNRRHTLRKVVLGVLVAESALASAGLVFALSLPPTASRSSLAFPIPIIGAITRSKTVALLSHSSCGQCWRGHIQWLASPEAAYHRLRLALPTSPSAAERNPEMVGERTGQTSLPSGAC